MTTRRLWTEHELLIALTLYCRLRYGQFHRNNPEIIKHSKLINRTPDALAIKLSNFASFDPKIIESGRKGYKNASKLDRQLWDEMNQDWEQFALRSHTALKALKVSLDDEVLIDYTGAEKLTLTKQRIGQKIFRTAILSAYEYKCCISGLTAPELLIASHIAPWRSDSQNRLKPRNGLALSALHDKAFDIGLLAIDSDYRMVISPTLKERKDSFLKKSLWAYHGRQIMLPKKFSPNPEFLRTHFETVFIH